MVIEKGAGFSDGYTYHLINTKMILNNCKKSESKESTFMYVRKVQGNWYRLKLA